MNEIIVNPQNHLEYKLITKELLYYLLEFNYEVRAYNYVSRRYELMNHKDYIYREDSEAYYIPRGFAMYLYTIKELLHLSQDSIKFLESELISTLDFSEFNWSNLKDYQINDLKELLQFKRGIFQNYTGYGKTEVIARLVEYLYHKGFNILIMVGGSKSLDELKQRIISRTGIDVPNYFDESSRINMINPNGFVRSSIYQDSSDNYWSSINICIADEVETMSSDSAFNIFDQLVHCEYFYGFGATADDKKGERIDIRYQLKGINSTSGKYITGVFSMATVYVLPRNLTINIKPYDVSMRIDFGELGNSSIYRDIIDQIWVQPEYLNAIIDICKSNDKITFIPMNNLSFIDEVFDRLLDTGLSVCTITGSGYYLNDHYVSLDELKDSIDKVKVIVGTATSFRALDFLGLTTVILTVGTKASQILQQVGRAARNSEFSIWYIRNDYTLPIYSRHTNEQLDLIKNYYKECKINEY